MDKKSNVLWFDYNLGMIFNPEKRIAVPFNNAAAAMQMKIILINNVPFEKAQTMH